MTFDGCTFNSPINASYAIFVQGTDAGTIIVNRCKFDNYTRGVNFQKANAFFEFTNNEIESTVSEPDRGAIQLTDGAKFIITDNTIKVSGGNAFWFHDAATNANVTYTISGNNINAPYLANDDTTFDVNNKITNGGNVYNNTNTVNCMGKNATEPTVSTVTSLIPIAKIGDKGYATLADALAAAQDGDTIKLIRDITVYDQINISKAISINLNGHKITSKYKYGAATNNPAYAFVLYKDVTILGASENGTKGSIATNDSIPIASVGHLTIKDAEIKAVSENENAYFVLIMFDDLNLENCTITGDTPDNYAIASMNDDNNFNIINSVVNATGEAIYHNGSYKNFTLNVENSTLNANYDAPNTHIAEETLGMYVSGSKALESLHNLTLKNSTVIGGTGIEIKYANLNMENCTVNAINPLSYEKNNNGSTAQGFAIVATDNTMDQEAADPQGKISINGGNYVGTIGLENYEHNVARDTDVTITGGTFTSDVAKYVAEGYYQKDNGNGTYTVLPVEAKVIDTAKTTGATVTLDNLNKNAVVNPAADATYKVVVETAPAADAKKANDAIKANADTNTSKAMFDISVVKVDSNGTETVLNNVTDQKVTLTLGETPATGTMVYVYHVKTDGTVEQVAAVPADGTNKVTFTAPSFSTYAATYTATPIAEANITKNVGVAFERVGDTSEYNIILKALDSKTINRFMSADLTFDMNVTSGAVGYTVNPAASVNLIDKGDGRYEFNLDGLTSSGATGTEVTIGTVTFEGNGSINFGVKTEGVTTNIVNTAKAANNIVDNYTTAGDGIDTGKLDVTNKLTGVTFTAPTKDLTVNIAYNNAISDQLAAYQDMTVTISGGDLTTPIVKHLGKDEYTLTDNAYTVEIADILTQNTAYTVTVEGAGYRTARYTVTMTANKTLNFWNNVMDANTYVEASVGTPSKTNFLAGDIVKDNNINIYDLSAVVSYFGTSNNVNAASAYAKYDLNRDGKIDSKDVAYVLVSWGK